MDGEINVNNLEEELYKKLYDESARIREKATSLWLQKLTLLGAVIAFIFIQHRDITQLFVQHEDGTQSAATPTQDPGQLLLIQFIVICAIFAVAGVALIIDTKILEYAMHARAISQFITEKFGQVELLSEWEGVVWEGRSGNQFARWASYANLLGTMIPTISVILLTGGLLGIFLESSQWSPVIAIVVCILYVISGVIAFRRLRI